MILVLEPEHAAALSRGRRHPLLAVLRHAIAASGGRLERHPFASSWAFARGIPANSVPQAIAEWRRIPGVVGVIAGPDAGLLAMPERRPARSTAAIRRIRSAAARPFRSLQLARATASRNRAGSPVALAPTTPRTVHYTQISAADTRPKVLGWRHSGLRVVGRPPKDDSPASLLADAMRRTRQARVVRTDPRHPWHRIARAQAAHKAGDHRKALAVLLAN